MHLITFNVQSSTQFAFFVCVECDYWHYWPTSRLQAHSQRCIHHRINLLWLWCTLTLFAPSHEQLCRSTFFLRMWIITCNLSTFHSLFWHSSQFCVLPLSKCTESPPRLGVTFPMVGSVRLWPFRREFVRGQVKAERTEKLEWLFLFLSLLRSQIYNSNKKWYCIERVGTVRSCFGLCNHISGFWLEAGKHTYTRPQKNGSIMWKHFFSLHSSLSLCIPLWCKIEAKASISM